MSRLSKRWPVFLETTGCWGTSPEMAQYILAGAFRVVGVALRGSLALGLFRRGLCWQSLAVPGRREAIRLTQREFKSCITLTQARSALHRTSTRAAQKWLRLLVCYRTLANHPALDARVYSAI